MWKKQNINIYTILLIPLIVFTIITYIYWNISNEYSAKFTGYVQLMTFVLFLTTAIITAWSFKLQNDDRNRMLAIQYINLTNSKISDIDRLFMNNSSLDRLYYEIYSHDPNIQKISEMVGNIESTPIILKAEHQASILIFQKISDIYVSENLERDITPQCIEWINIFRSWMKSPILLNHWKYLQYELNPVVRNFINKYLISKNKFIKKL